MITSLVWAGVALVAVVLAYRAALMLGGRKVATKTEVAELGAAMDSLVTKMGHDAGQLRHELGKHRADIDQQLGALSDRVEAIDQRTDPTGQVPHGPLRPGRRT